MSAWQYFFIWKIIMLQECIALPIVQTRAPETLLVNVTPRETRVAVLEEGKVCELHIERNVGRGIVGNIYLGVVRRVLPGMQSAFIDIGLERAAFLHIVDVLEHRQSLTQEQRIEQLFFEGQKILVQVIKDPVDAKGARLSTQISLAGRFLVHLPQDEHIGISQRIGNEEERIDLKNRLERILPENACHGYIIRTCAQNVDDDSLRFDVAYLTRLWRNIDFLSKTSVAPCLIYQDLPLTLRTLRDLFSGNTQRILVDSRKHLQLMREFASAYVHGIEEKIDLFEGQTPIFEYYGVESAIDKALSARVNLRFGGYLIIEPTEAMTTIDVNTGGFVGNHNFAETILKTNLEACHAIALEMRLRNIGGMILVDFIDMGDEEHRQLVLQELAKCLSQDRTRVTLNGFTSLGLVEITRKRTRESLQHLLSEPCQCCGGSGRIKTLPTVCYEIMREVTRIAKMTEVNHFRILASAAVIEMLIDEESEALAKLSDFIGKEIFLAVESLYNQNEFDVVVA